MKKLYRHINKADLNAYELEQKRLSYYNLFYKDENRLLCNNIIEDYENNELEFGEDYYEDEDGEIIYRDFYQYYLIDYDTAKRLGEIGETIYYNSKLDIYFLAVSHFGTSWGYVLTDIKLEPSEWGEDYYDAYTETEEEDDE